MQWMVEERCLAHLGGAGEVMEAIAELPLTPRKRGPNIAALLLVALPRVR